MPSAAMGVGFDMTLLPLMVGRNFRDCQALIVERHGEDYPTAALMQAWHVAYDAMSSATASRSSRVSSSSSTGSTRKAFPRRSPLPRAATVRRRSSRRPRLLSRFATLVGGDEIARGKPAPDIFLAAAQRLGEAPADIVVLEDSEPGVLAALAAGMMPIMVPDLHPPSPVCSRWSRWSWHRWPTRTRISPLCLADARGIMGR